MRWPMYLSVLAVSLLVVTGLRSQQPNTLILPIDQDVNLGQTVLSIRNKGSGRVLEIKLEDLLSTEAAALLESLGNGPAVRARAKGSGAAIEAVTTGTGPSATFRNDNAASLSPALEVSTASNGPAAVVRGDLRIEGELKVRGANVVPIGAILPFWGDPATLDESWVLCDGREINVEGSPLKGQRSPNLVEMFLRGANGQAQLGATGGRDNIPSHSHYFSQTASVWIPMTSGNGHLNIYAPATSAGGFDNSLRNLTTHANPTNPYESHGHMNGTASVYGHTSSSGEFDNRPRFVSMHFIMRVK